MHEFLKKNNNNSNNSNNSNSNNKNKNKNNNINKKYIIINCECLNDWPLKYDSSS